MGADVVPEYEYELYQSSSGGFWYYKIYRHERQIHVKPEESYMKWLAHRKARRAIRKLVFPKKDRYAYNPQRKGK